MRRVLLVIITVIVLAVGFGTFLWLQGNIPMPGKPTPLSAASRPSPDIQGVGKGEGVWVMTYDQKTGLPMVRFRAQRYLPQSGDLVNVEHPQAEFFVGPRRSQVLRIEGKTGSVVLAGEAPRVRSDLTSTPMQSPRRGQMRDVIITFFPNQQAMVHNTPELTMTLNNAYFDNDTFEIATEGYVDETGNKVGGQDVPIKVRGESVDFDGTGLYIRWDDRSQRLKSLTVHRSDRLVIKKPFGRTEPQEAWPDHQQAVTPGASPTPLTPAAAPETGSKPERSAPSYYRATLRDNVRITQAEQLLASGNKMEIDFIASDAEADKDDARNAPEQEHAAPAAARNANSIHDAPQSSPSFPSPAKPNQSPLNQKDPVVIRWSGEMTVTPIVEKLQITPANSDDAVIHLTGSPAMMQSQGYRIESGTAVYQLSRQYAWVDGSADAPVRMTTIPIPGAAADTRDAVLLTPQLRFDQKQGIATLNGPSSATMQVIQDGKKATLVSTWRDKAQAFFANADSSSPHLSQLVLQGNVDVRHPRLQRFHAGFLTLDFPPTQPDQPADPVASVQQITAQENVDCVLVDDKGKLVPIRCRNLKLRMAQGDHQQLFPSRIEADGKVVAGDDTQQIKADSLRANLNQKTPTPDATTSELAGLKDLVATGNVEVHSPQVEQLQGQRLEVKPQGNQDAWILLEGTSDKPARVVRAGPAGNTTISGRLIEVNSTAQTALVTGGGRLTLPGKAVSPTAKDAPANAPVEVTWTGDGRVDGQKNTATVEDNVYVKYIDSDGSLNEATGDRVEIVLAKNPKAKPNLRLDGGAMAALSDRYILQLSLIGLQGRDIQLQRLRMDGTFIDHQINIFGPRMDCQFSPDGLEKLTVPAASKYKPGRMLYVSMPAATRKPVKTQDPFKSTNLPGATAFSWTQALVYDHTKEELTLNGGVLIRHKPQAPDGLSFDIRADSLVADAKPPANAAAGTATPQPDKIILSGNPVQIERRDVLLTSPLVEVYPKTSDIVARGTARNPVNVERGKDTGSFTEVYLNTETQYVKAVGVSGVGRR